MTALRIMLQEGENEFRTYLQAVRKDPAALRPDLNRTPFSQEFSPRIEVDEAGTFRSKLDLAAYLDDCFGRVGLRRETILGNKGLWTWLAYLWFEQLTNRRSNILKRDEHYICAETSNYRRYYIHLVSPPYIIYSHRGLRPFSMLFLYNPPWEINDFTERVAANQFLISHVDVVEAIYSLYFDQSKGKPKPRATSRGVAGSVRSFIRVFQQLELTYDVYSMSPEEIIDLLPSEFDYWKSGKL
jgi:hypothetical protein